MIICSSVYFKFHIISLSITRISRRLYSYAVIVLFAKRLFDVFRLSEHLITSVGVTARSAPTGELSDRQTDGQTERRGGWSQSHPRTSQRRHHYSSCASCCWHCTCFIIASNHIIRLLRPHNRAYTINLPVTCVTDLQETFTVLYAAWRWFFDAHQHSTATQSAT